MDDDPRTTPVGGDTRAAGDEVGEPGLSRRTVLAVVAVVVVFALITWYRSAQVGITLRDPRGKLLRGRAELTAVLVVAFALAQAAWVAVRRHRSVRGLAAVPAVLRERWPWRRVVGVVVALVAYYAVYVCYRNMKSWTAFRADRDHDLMAVDRALFGGHTPAAMLHHLFGQHASALTFAHIYDSFPNLVTISIAGSVVLVRPAARALLFIASMMWIWILGTATYYLVPSLGPFATYPQYFAGLSPNSVGHEQHIYLLQRAMLLAHPDAPTSYASISAFASLHCGVTCVLALMVYRYGHHRWAALLGVYLVAIMVSTIYVGMHFVVDDIGGIAIAVASVWLGRLTVGRAVPLRRTRSAPTDRTDAEPIGTRA